MKYKIKTTPKVKTPWPIDDIEGIEEALDTASDIMDLKDSKPIVAVVENEYEEEICIFFDGRLYQECDYGDAREYAEEMAEDHEEDLNV